MFSRAAPGPAPTVEAIVHFDVSPLDKATAGACSPDVTCPSGDAALDAAIAERRNSVALVNFVEGTEARVCTGTLLNTGKFPVPFMLTANHCIATAAAAASVTTLWFNEAASCGSSAVSPAVRQVTGGATLVFTSHGPDSTLLQLRKDPPAGAVYAGWNAARLAEGDAVVSISHPQGDVKKFALGEEQAELQVRNYPQQMYGVSFTRGVTEGGSSGSALFTLDGGSLQVRGVLSGSTFRSGSALSCSNAETEEALYGRFEIFHPQIADYISASPPARGDDFGNRVTEAQRIFPVAQAAFAEVAYPGPARTRRGRGRLPRRRSAGRGHAHPAGPTGGTDTIGTLLDSAGRTIRSVNDAQSDGPDFGLTRTLDPGTYYLALSHREAQGTGDYTLKASLSTVTDNYTDLWWNPDGAGLGRSTSTTRATRSSPRSSPTTATGSPCGSWPPSVTRQPDGATGRAALPRAPGPAFNASPWAPVAARAVGTMRPAPSTSRDEATLSYSVDGVAVTKTIQRQVFSADTRLPLVRLRPQPHAPTSRTCGGTRRSRAGASTSRTRATSSSPRSSPTTRTGATSGS